jgi:hypothetical protein
LRILATITGPLKPAEILNCLIWPVLVCGEFVANPQEQRLAAIRTLDEVERIAI